MDIVGERVILKEITREDTELIIHWRNKKFVQERFIFQEKLTKEEHEKWLSDMVATGRVKQFIIILKNGMIPIGSAYLRDIDKKNRKAEYGIFIGEEDATGLGYGSDVTKLLSEYAFKRLSLHKVYLRVFSDNKRAIQSYTKAGFVQEALLRDEIKIGNKFKDIVLMSLLDPSNSS